MIALEQRGDAVAGAAARRKGVLALARITELTQTGTGPNDQAEVRISLHISGPGLTFDSAARVTVNAARRANVDAGQLVVLVDPATRQYQIDWDRSALVNGLVPAKFSLSTGGVRDLSGQTGPLMEILQILWAHNVSLSRLSDPRTDPAVGERVQTVLRRAAPR
jgi:hypothetical protein